jgi:hypothetical protein
MLYYFVSGNAPHCHKTTYIELNMSFFLFQEKAES